MTLPKKELDLDLTLEQLTNSLEEIPSKETSVTLYGIERAVAQGLQRITTVEKYENKIRMGDNDNSKDTIPNSDNNYTVPVEIQIPYNANTSYIGKYSEYYWGVEAKINLPWSSDIYARSMVEV